MLLKTQAVTQGKCQYMYSLLLDDKIVKIQPIISQFYSVGVTLDQDFSFKPDVTIMLKRAYAKIPALRRIKHLSLCIRPMCCFILNTVAHHYAIK